MGKNGDNEIDGLGETEALDIESEVQAEGRKLDKTLDQGKIGGTFSTPQNTDNCRLLMTPGELLSLLMRANIPDKRYAVALASYIRKCRKHNYTDGERQILMQTAAMVGEKGARAKLVGDILIGQRDAVSGGRNGGGVAEKIKKWALNSGD